MRTRIIRFIGWLVRTTGALARRLVGAIVAATAVAFIALVILLLLIFAGDQLPFAEYGLAIRIVVGVITAIAGILAAALAGFIWPGPLLAVLHAFDWLPTPDSDSSGFNFFDFDD